MIRCIKKKTPEETLFDIFQNLKIEAYKKTVLQQRYIEVLRNFHIRSRRLEIMFYAARIIVTVGSILVPAFLSIQGSGSNSQTQIYWATWVISLLVTISNGFMTLFKLDKKYFFINTTLELLHSEGWQYVGLSGRYSPKDTVIPPTHENQFLVFFHMAEKIKMRQVEEEFWKFTDTSGVGNATNQKAPFVSPTPAVQQGQLSSLPDEQKNVIESWVSDMNTNMLGLQPRGRNMLNKVDGTKGPRNPGLSESSENTPMPMRPQLQKSTPTREAMVFIPSPTAIPENTVIQVVQEESDVWSGTETRYRSVEP